MDSKASPIVTFAGLLGTRSEVLAILVHHAIYHLIAWTKAPQQSLYLALLHRSEKTQLSQSIKGAKIRMCEVVGVDTP